MLKSVVLFVFLWHEMCQFSSHAAQDLRTDIASPEINETHVKLDPMGNHNFMASKQIFHVNGPLIRISGFGRNLNSIDDVLGSDNLATNAIGVYKVHRRIVTWGKARQFCLQEGGHLATMNSEEEEKTVLKLMTEASVDQAWVGYHDQFVEGDWISVFDEPLDESGWERWSKTFPVNPDNYGGSQNCGVLMGKGGGLDDQNCDIVKSFVCKKETI